MNDVEQRVREALHDPFWELPAPADPAAWAKRRAHRARRRLLAVPAAAAIAVAAVTVVIALPLSPERRADPPAGGSAATGWGRLPDPPLSPRTGSIVVAVGAEVLVLGGNVGKPCPAGASCDQPPELTRDGAAYDPARDRWRSLAPAPVDLPDHSRAAVAGGQVFVLIRSTVYGYDPGADAWTTLPPLLPADGAWSHLVGWGRRLVAVRSVQRDDHHPDRVFDTGSRTWSALPRDPLVPSFDRELVPIAGGLVLTGKAEVDQPGAGSTPAVLRAAVYDERTGAWRRLADSDQLGGSGWAWTGRRLVDPTPGGADGGADGYGRVVPYGGTLDPVTGTWGRLPRPPTEASGGWPVSAIGGVRSAASGWLYDDGDGSWTRIGRPAGGPEHPGSAAWAGGALYVFGGYGEGGDLSAAAFALRP